MTNTVIINNLDEAVQYFIQKKTKENIELCKIEPHYHNHGLTGEPIYYILERIDKNCYFLFYREDSKKGFEDEFGLPSHSLQMSKNFKLSNSVHKLMNKQFS